MLNVSMLLPLIWLLVCASTLLGLGLLTFLLLHSHLQAKQTAKLTDLLEKAQSLLASGDPLSYQAIQAMSTPQNLEEQIFSEPADTTEGFFDELDPTASGILDELAGR